MTNDENSQLFLERRKQHIKLSPKYMNNLREGISQHLSGLLSLQDKTCDGFPVAYSNIKIDQTFGKIVSDQACIHFDVHADFIIFKPTVGCKLRGKVNKVAKRHVGCLVHEHFNAWVPQTSVTEGIAINHLMGAQLEFTVQAIEINRNVLSIKGKLEKIINNRAERTSISINPITLTKKEINQKMKLIKEEEKKKELALKQHAALEGEDQVDMKKSKKKKKKKGKDDLESTIKADKTSFGQGESHGDGQEEIVDSGVSLENELDTCNLSAENNLKENSLKRLKKKKKEKKNKGKDVSDAEENVNNVNEGTNNGTEVFNASIMSVGSFDPVFTSTQLDPGLVHHRHHGKNKKKKRKKDNTMEVESRGEHAIGGNVSVVNSDMSENLGSELNTSVRNTDSEPGKLSRKRRHQDSSFTKLKSPDREHLSTDLVLPSPAKKGKLGAVETITQSDSYQDSEVGSLHSKKSKKKKKHKE